MTGPICLSAADAPSGGLTGIVPAKPVFVGVSINENGGNVSFLWTDGAYSKVGGSDTFDAAYRFVDGAVGHFALGCGGTDDTTTIDTGMRASNGLRLYAAAMWTRNLTKSGFDNIMKFMAGRR